MTALPEETPQENGEKTAAYPRARQRDEAQYEANPIHTGVTKDTASTPGYFRLLLPGLAGRYMLRWGVDELKDIRNDLRHLNIWRKQSPEERTAIARVKLENGKGDAAKIVGVAEALKEQVNNGQKAEALLVSAEARAAERLMWHHGIGEERLGEMLKEEESLSKFSRSAEDRVYKNRAGRTYDYLLGSASVLLSGYYDLRVASDIKKVYAETVAYETGKKPEDVSYSDLMHSENALVQGTKRSFLKKSALRFGTDAVFFLGGVLEHLPRMGWLKKYAFTDLGVGMKGSALIVEVLNKKTTVLEDLMQLIDTKLNPLKGLGAPISTGDVFDLYQKYTQEHDPGASFHDAVSSQNRDGRDWSKAQVIFQRVTDLMNQTYKYKHTTAANVKNDVPCCDFALPKFLYLLGNGLIDTYKPEQTLAYIEVANRYGMEAVKQVRKSFERGLSVEQALVNYPLELKENIHTIYQSAPRQEMRPPSPDTRVHAVAERRALLDPALAAQVGVSL